MQTYAFWKLREELREKYVYLLHKPTYLPFLFLYFFHGFKVTSRVISFPPRGLSLYFL